MNGRYQEKLRRQFLKSAMLPILASFAIFALLLTAYSEGFARYSLGTHADQAKKTADSIYDFYASYLTDEEAQTDLVSFLKGEMSDRLMTYSFRMRCSEEPARADLLLLNAQGEQVYYSGRSDVTLVYPEYYRETLFETRPRDRSILSRFYFFLGDASWILNAVVFDESGDPVGQAFLLMREDDLVNAFRLPGYEIVLHDSNHLAAMTTNHALVDNRHRMPSAGFGVYSDGSNSYLVQSEPLTRSDAGVTVFAARRDWKGYVIPYLGILLFLLALITYESARFSRNLALASARSLEKLHSELSSVRKDPDLRLSLDSDDEFSDIAGSINRLLDRISELNRTSLDLERNRNDLEKAQLKARFHPHFIYNTLESIRFAILMDDSKRASDMLLALTSLLRYSVDHNDYISLEEDAEHIREYLDIMQFRYGKRFRYSFDIAPDTLSYLIPPLFIQPLLENSLKYGFAEQDNLELSVKTWMEGDSLHILVKDDGIGMTPEELSLQRRLLEEGQFAKGHFGIGLVARSLKLQYGEGSTVELDSEYGEGLTVSLTLEKKVEQNGL